MTNEGHGIVAMVLRPKEHAPQGVVRILLGILLALPLRVLLLDEHKAVQRKWLCPGHGVAMLFLLQLLLLLPTIQMDLMQGKTTERWG